jgi:hypothetical protein
MVAARMTDKIPTTKTLSGIFRSRMHSPHLPGLLAGLSTLAVLAILGLLLEILPVLRQRDH